MKSSIKSVFLGMVGLFVASSASAATTYNTISVADYIISPTNQITFENEGGLRTVHCYTASNTGYASFTIPLHTPTTSLATGNLQVDVGFSTYVLDSNNRGVTAQLVLYNDAGQKVGDTTPVSASFNSNGTHTFNLGLMNQFTPSVHRAYLNISVGCAGTPGSSSWTQMTRVNWVRYWYNA